VHPGGELAVVAPKADIGGHLDAALKTHDDANKAGMARRGRTMKSTARTSPGGGDVGFEDQVSPR
jgi:hypothetical protein